MSQETPVSIQLLIHQGSQLVQTIKVQQPLIQMGSLPSSQVRLDDPSVARVHALIENKGLGQVYLVDLGTATGTYLNGRKIERALLSAGDEIVLGQVRILVDMPKSLVTSARSPHAAPRLEPARIVHVHALYDGAILNTTQLDNPKGHTKHPLTLFLLSTALLALLLCGLCSVMLYNHAKAVEGLKAAWVASGLPAQSFRPVSAGIVWQAGAPIFLVYALVGVTAGFWLFSRNRRPAEFTMGTHPAADLPLLEPLPMNLFPVVRAAGSHYEVWFTTAMRGELRVGDATCNLNEAIQLGYAKSSAIPGIFVLPVLQDSKIAIEVGGVQVVVVGLQGATLLPVTFAIAWGALGVVLSLFVYLCFVIWLMPKSPSDVEFVPPQEIIDMENRVKQSTEADQEKRKQEKKVDNEKEGEGRSGKRAKGDEGKMGKEDAQKANKRFGIQGDPKNKLQPFTKEYKKELARDAASKSGVLGIFRAGGGPGLESLLAPGPALGVDAKSGLGPLQGAEVGDAYGAGGFALVGVGRGGGGNGEGTIGLTNLGTVGKGSGNKGDGGGGYRPGGGDLKKRKAGVPDALLGTAEVRGSLDKELIRRVIRQHINEVKFCYEKQLRINNKLQGRVVVQFTIAGTGKVLASMVQSSTLGDPATEQCIAQAIRRWDFPKPQGGGIVVVSYPFVLKEAGSE